MDVDEGEHRVAGESVEPFAVKWWRLGDEHVALVSARTRAVPASIAITKPYDYFAIIGTKPLCVMYSCSDAFFALANRFFTVDTVVTPS